MRFAPLFAALMVIALPAVSRADCAMEIETVQARIKKEANGQVKAAANKHLQTALEQKERGDEIECHNAVTRAWRALRTPPEAPKKK
jgi:hypothetical protein